ncbi:MAG: peptidoglycan DD-metalloendopeptidase family protein [Pseudohongiellaceae bacterium]|nr:peptidoglycan DD-metalloendopeptidase family protein [Pseudohongiellaceae bacterium]
MDLIDSAKQTLSKYYPRNHFILASGLSLVLVVTLAFTPEEADTDSAQADKGTLNIPLAIELSEPAPAPALMPETEAPTAPTTPAVDEETYSAWTDLKVESGDNLTSIFNRVGLSSQSMYKVLNSNSEAKVLNALYPGYELSFRIPEPGKLEQLKLLKSPLEGYLFTLNEDSYVVESILHTPDVTTAFKESTINDSLFMAAQRANIPTAATMEMANIFGGVIDFALETRSGDNFGILYEEKYLNGEFIGNGEVLAAQFTNQGKQFIALRYENEAGEVGYFSPEGESMRKAFLRTPLDVFRISSNFNLNRRHPILNTIRAHKGTDYAAPRGTPVRATSDGTVTWAARNGSFGKLIVIKHRGEFETKYAHLNDYAKGIKKGARVTQGQIIGYVGTTGGSTGPHLHYEFLVGGVHKNPRTIIDQLPKAVSIDPEEMPRFRAQTADLLAKFRSYSEDKTLLSMNTSAETTITR